MTELIWEGKYKDGKRASPVRIALPFQTIETINESAQQRQKMRNSFPSGHDREWRNRLIWGDKKYVLPSLLSEFAGQVKLVYIDPPFDTGANFSFNATIPDNPDTPENETTDFIKRPSIVEQKAYRDTWGRKGIDSYLRWFYETAVILYELLAEDGSFYVHIDWHVGHYVKAVLDEIFGYENFRNEIFVKRVRKNVRERELVKSLNVAADSVLFYSKSKTTSLRPPMRPEMKKARWHTFKASGFRRGMDYELFGKKPSNTNHWRWTREKTKIAIKEGRLRPNPRTGNPEYFIGATSETLCDSLWNDLQAYTFKHNYPTEKNEALIERIIKASANNGDLILDCFVGSGTTAVVAEKLGCRWIACDLSRFAIHTSRKRLLSIPNIKPFIVQNFGKYERQAWQTAEFSIQESQKEKDLKYRKFILELYKANRVRGYSWLHGLKNGRMIHVGSVDAPVTLADVKAISAEVWKSVGKGKNSAEIAAMDILGWDFALEVNEVAKQVAANANIDVAFKIIPRELLEKKAVEQGDIKFFELASLSIEIKTKGEKVTASLTDFVIPPQDLPENVQKAITHWSQWIDYWAIDWNYKNDTFHNQWQSYCTRKRRKVELEANYVYEIPGDYDVMVKVFDILGNDTTKLLRVKVGSVSGDEMIK